MWPIFSCDLVTGFRNSPCCGLKGVVQSRGFGARGNLFSGFWWRVLQIPLKKAWFFSGLSLSPQNWWLAGGFKQKRIIRILKFIVLTTWFCCPQWTSRKSTNQRGFQGMGDIFFRACQEMEICNHFWWCENSVVDQGTKQWAPRGRLIGDDNFYLLFVGYVGSHCILYSMIPN